MSDIDWIILGVLGISGVISLLRGFVKEALSLLIWFIALVIAISLGPKLAHLLSGWFAHDMLQMIAAFCLLFIGTLITGGLLNQIITSLVAKAGLGPLDRLLGMVFGVLRGAIMVLACLIIIPPLISVEDATWWQSSVLIPKFLMMEEWALATFSDLAKWRYQLLV